MSKSDWIEINMRDQMKCSRDWTQMCFTKSQNVLEEDLKKPLENIFPIRKTIWQHGGPVQFGIKLKTKSVIASA